MDHHLLDLNPRRLNIGLQISSKKLINLTLTINFVKNGINKFIFANFDNINSLIVIKVGTISCEI
jgi:hypothetical protein